MMHLNNVVLCDDALDELGRSFSFKEFVYEVKKAVKKRKDGGLMVWIPSIGTMYKFVNTRCDKIGVGRYQKKEETYEQTKN